jgi:hypothetical protein
MTYEPRNLKRWTLPDSYFGEIWPNYYSSGFGQSRDSDDLEQSNFATALKALGGESETVQVVRESHWAVGWVEWIAIHQDDDKALEIADELRDRYENYPVLDDDDWSAREWETVCSAWERSDLRERIYVCNRFGVSIFAARRDELPPDDNGAIYEYLRQS